MCAIVHIHLVDIVGFSAWWTTQHVDRCVCVVQALHWQLEQGETERKAIGEQVVLVEQRERLEVDELRTALQVGQHCR